MLAGDMTGLHEVDCRISISGSQLVSGGNTREGWRRAAGEERGLVAIVWVWGGGGFAAMTTDGGGSKQMSTSWQTGARVAEPLRDRWTSRSTVGLQSHCEAKQACAYRTQTLS